LCSTKGSCYQDSCVESFLEATQEIGETQGTDGWDGLGQPVKRGSKSVPPSFLSQDYLLNTFYACLGLTQPEVRWRGYCSYVITGAVTGGPDCREEREGSGDVCREGDQAEGPTGAKAGRWSIHRVRLGEARGRSRTREGQTDGVWPGHGGWEAPAGSLVVTLSEICLDVTCPLWLASRIGLGARSEGRSVESVIERWPA
jgi:hypothetical protein